MEKDCFVFWKRIFAFILDYSIIVGICYVIVNALFYQLTEFGNWTILIGFLVFILYFGIQDSKISKGQTLAKRLFQINVVDKNNNFLNIYKSIFRASLLSICLFFPCGIYLFDLESIFNYSIYAVSIIFLFSSVLLFVFNTPTRQTLPDIITESYVTNKNIKIDDIIIDYVPVKFYLGIQRVSARLSTVNFKIPSKLIKILIVGGTTAIISILAYISYSNSASYSFIINNIQNDLKNTDEAYKLTYIADYTLPPANYNLIFEVTINKKDISDDITILRSKIPYIVNKQMPNNNYTIIQTYIGQKVNTGIFKKVSYKMYKINNIKATL